MTDFTTTAPTVRRLLGDMATRVSGFDPDLAAHLSDLANDYAGPAVNPQVSDEEWQRQRERA